jgi:hypothetical protein
MDDRLNRDYTIQMVMGTVNLQCPAVGDAGGDMDATTEAGDDASGME